MFFPLNSPDFLIARMQRVAFLLAMIAVCAAFQTALTDELHTGSVATGVSPLPTPGAPASLTVTQPAAKTATNACKCWPRSTTATQPAAQTVSYTFSHSATAPRSATATAPRSATTTRPAAKTGTNSRIGKTYSFTIGAY